MKPQSKQTPRNILSSVDQYEFRHLNAMQIKQIEEIEDQQIFFYKKSIGRKRIQSASQNINNNQRSKRKNSQRYMKGNKEKNSELIFSKTYDQKFFSCSKQVPFRQETRQTHKTISTYKIDEQNEINPQVIELALRYGILNRKSKNSSYEILRKKPKKSINKNFNQMIEKRNPKLSIDLNVDQQFKKVLIRNKNTLESLGSTSNKYVQNISLMLDRKKIVQQVKQSSDKTYQNVSMTGQNKQFTDNVKMVQKKNENKIQAFIKDKIEHENKNLKNKIHKNQMVKTCFNRFPVQNNILKQNHVVDPYNKNVKTQNQIFKNTWSNKIYFPQNQKPIKHTNFITAKNSTQRIQNTNKKEQNKQILKGRKSDVYCNRKQSKMQIIPNPNIFQKQSSQGKKGIIGKIVKNVSRQLSSVKQNTQLIKKFQKSENYMNRIEKTQSKLILERKMINKEVRPSTQGSPSRVSRKQNYPLKNQQFTFVFDSKDHPYIAEYLIANSWVSYVPNKLNTQWRLKWVNNPVSSQILKLKDGQLYNHFHKSFELTSKSFLSLNLKANQHFLKTDDFFPETYDIGNEMERNQFIKRFKYHVMMTLLQNIIVYCFRKGKISHLMENLKQIEDKYEQIESQSDKLLQNQSFNVIEFQNYKNRDENFQINIFLTILMVKYLRKQRTKHYIDFKEKKNHFLRFKKDEFDNNIQVLEFYSKQQDVSRSQDSKGLFSYHFATPSDLLLEILVKEYCFFQRMNNWKYELKKDTKNSSNIWIIKPSSNARGNGIYLETDLGSILKSAKDIQSRIVQKYIEKPLLFKNTPYSYLNNHKFDIRQWVLLKSLDPLEIYMFSHFYIRLASQKYELYPIENNKVHLTNFSANKQFFNNQENSIVSSDEFINFLRQQNGINWSDQLKPKVIEIIIKSIQSCQQKLQAPQNGSCFELLGYDIFIDQKFHPWLIEVNMSPACEQRSTWLTSYLKNMNEGLLEIVLPHKKISKIPPSNRKQKWQRIHFEEYHFNAKDCNSKLEVVSTNLQSKNKLSKQNQLIKSKKSIQGPLSPNKIRSIKYQKKTIRKQSASKAMKNIDQAKQTLHEQSNHIEKISQIDMDPLNQSIFAQDILDIEKDFQGDNNQLIEQIHQISQDQNDSFQQNLTEEQIITDQLQQEIDIK